MIIHPPIHKSIEKRMRNPAESCSGYNAQQSLSWFDTSLDLSDKKSDTILIVEGGTGIKLHEIWIFMAFFTNHPNWANLEPWDIIYKNTWIKQFVSFGIQSKHISFLFYFLSRIIYRMSQNKISIRKTSWNCYLWVPDV